MQLILASASPRRKDLLEQAGLSFQISVAEVEEKSDGPPAELAMENAEIKARAVAERFPQDVVLGADTVVVLDGKVLGKPRDPAEARAMLRALSGRENQVITGLAWMAAGTLERMSVCTRVFFRELGDAEIDAYVASGEPMDKAGAYGIQGGAASFVQRIEGSYTNVVGLPLAEVVEQVRRCL